MLGRTDDGGEKPAAAIRKPAYEAGPFRLAVWVQPETPTVGENRLFLSLQDREGDPIADASIKAVATMPAMGAMPAMQAPADLEEIEPGLYVGPFDLSMSGAWPLTLEIQKSDLGRAQVSFDLATGRKGLQLATGARPLGGVDDGSGEGGMTARDGDVGMPIIPIDNRRRQLIGVETEPVERRVLVREIRAVGEVGYDETRIADVTLRFDAWIGDLQADYVGKEVKRGEVLFTVYGPDLLAAQQEYLEIYRRAQAGPNRFLEAARKRLMLWNMAPQQIEALEQRGEPLDYVPILAPLSGTIVEKNIVTGTAHRAGMTLLRIADLSRIWIDAKVYDSELPLIRKGMPAEVTLPYLPGATYRATVDYVYPYLQGDTRTGRIRLSLPNPNEELKPGMYAEVKLQAKLGERLAVPESSVLFSGDTRVVFVDLGGGRLQPRRIETGQRTEDYIAVISGLEPGEAVVTSGNFLIDAETRLKTGINQW
jgi:Cu(I)/Ag(I) efflux system membrane fusion protein